MVPHSPLLALGFHFHRRCFSLNLITIFERSQGFVRTNNYFVARLQTALDLDLLIAFDPGGDRLEVTASVLAEHEHAFNFFLLLRAAGLLRGLLIFRRFARHDRLKWR